VTTFLEIHHRNTLLIATRFGIPELALPKPKGVLSVEEGRCVDGNERHIFESELFTECSGLVLHNPLSKRYGLFHIFPGQEIYPEIESLRRLTGSTGILIEGSESTPKKRILNELNTLFAINISRAISIDTIRQPSESETEGRQSDPFNVIYRPMANKILVARISHQDVLVFQGF
jgi:hypothetical protein